uniref:Retrotransposon gag domain-containing protein n=1 Tax=Tanacetum cinerariifolium TaxID=118510 RepID=A0A6L2K0P8_TANCI|nr:hypothetical protein [Tanacetum cinerariifolium]
MRTRSYSNLVGESSPNPTTSNPKRRNHRRFKQPFILEESPVDTRADQRTMAELLRAPTKDYAEAIVVPPILAEHFELKHSLINMMTSDQFFGLEKDNPHDHIRWFNKITSTIKYKDVPNSAIKLTLFPFSLAGAARRWLEKEPPHSILTWEDLVSNFINEFFPPSRTTNLRNEISNFQKRFDESFHEAWDRYKDLLHACPRHGFTELHQLYTFYNALNPADQDSLNSAADGNLLERIAKLTHAINQQTSVMTTTMTSILKQFQATPYPASVKCIEEICVSFSAAHSYYQCPAADGNTFSEFRDNIQGYVSAAVVNYNQVVTLSELEKIKKMNEINIKAMQTQINNVKNELRNEMKTSIQASMSNLTNELKNMMDSFFQMNTASTSGSRPLPRNTIANPKSKLKAITTRSGLVLDGPSVPMPLPFINPKEDERAEETLTDQDLVEYTIKVPPPLVQKAKPPSLRNYVVYQRDPRRPHIPYPSRMNQEKQQEKDEIHVHKFWKMFKQLHINITLADALILILKYQKMLKALLSNKEKLLELANTPLNENCSAIILKKLPEKLRDLGKFLISCGFSELKCKALADLGAGINLMPLSVWKKLGLPKLISTRMTLELANRAICTLDGIARDVFVPVGKFTFLANFVIVDYKSDPRVPIILGRPFLWTARALIDVHGEEMILCDSDERLTLNMRHDTSSYSNHPYKKSINMINIYNDSYEDYLEDLLSTNHLSDNPTFSSHTDLNSPKVINPLSDNTTFSSLDHLLEEFADKLTLITFPLGNDDLPFDIESDLREIEYLLNHDPTKEMDFILEDSVDECNLADPNNDLFVTIPEMFTDEHTLDYSSPPLYDDVDDDLVKLEFENVYVYDDPFDSKEDKIKESKFLIDELDPSRSSDFLPSPECDSILYEDFSEGDALPSTNNKDKVFNLGILIHENLFEVTNRVTPDKNVKKISKSNAYLILKDFDPPLYELPFHKEVPGSETLLLYSSENKEKVFNPEILTSKGVHTSLLPELSHRGPKAFKVIKIFESPMEIFPCSYGEDIRILDVLRSQRGKIDKTLFIRRNKDDILLVQVYVDDIIFGELTFFLGLQVKQKQDGIFISQDKYVYKILKKYGFLEVKNASTPMETQKPLLKDEDSEEVDVHLYRSMIGSLMYLTSLKPDIMFAAKTINGEVQLQALVDGKKVIITESTIRRDLQLEDAEGVDCLPNAAIFEQLTLMGKPRRKVTEVPQSSDSIENVADEAINEEMDDSLERAATTATSLDAEQDRGNIFKIQSNATPNDLIPKELVHVVVLGVNTPQVVGLSSRVESFKDEGLGEEDVSKQGRIADIDANKDIYLVNVYKDEEITAASTPTISINEASLAQVLAKLKHAKPKAKAKEIVFYKPEESTTTTTTTAIPKPNHRSRIRKMFDRAFKRVNTFVDFRTELVEESSKKAEAELVKSIPDEEGVAIDDIPLAVKPPSIVDWKIQKEGKKTYYKIIMADGSSKIYLVFSYMLKDFERKDVETLWKLATYTSVAWVIYTLYLGELYTFIREHVRMIVKSVENGPLIWPTVEENEVTRTKKYTELSAAEKIQADCDMQATNIFFQGDDLIFYLNKAMAFLTVVASLRGDKGKVILVLVIRVMPLVLGETMQVDRKRLFNAITIKVKDIWLGNALSLNDQAMQHDPGVADSQAVQTIIPNNAAFQTDDLDTYDSDCDDVSNAKAVLMANISNYGSDIISNVPQSETYLNDMEN